jgi:L-lactate dehydrogenase complex protein LldG
MANDAMTIDTQAARRNIFQKLGHSATSSDEVISSKPYQGSLSQHSTEQLVEYFRRVLSAHNTTVSSIEAITELPQAVADYLSHLTVDPIIFGGENPLLNTLAWSRVGLQWEQSEFTHDGQVAIASADYGIADTGTVVLQSSAKNPTRNNFLAEHHIVVLNKETILPYSEDVWAAMLANNPVLPRAINFISGPSSSADVGLKLEYGAHGPRTLAVFLY